MFRLTVKDLSKRFGPRKLFSSLNIDLVTGDSLAVTGPNGSGKSTLLKLLLGLSRPTRGSVEYTTDGVGLVEGDRRCRVGFVAPYLNLYELLSAEENLKFLSTVSGGSVTGKEINRLLACVGLEGRGNDLVVEYSSGMKQRLKYCAALLNDPDFLFLDEPTASLDESGKKLILDIIDERRASSIIVVATNETEEYHLASRQCRLGQ